MSFAKFASRLFRPARHATAHCATCVHFVNAPAQVEAALSGIKSMGSAYSAVRSDDGMCALHHRYLSARSTCDAHRSA